MERLNPLNDFLFLKLMGEEGNEVQCLSFLNAVLGSKTNPFLLGTGIYKRDFQR